MNKKLLLTGKTVLSTVMASTMTCSLLSTSICAQEQEPVPEETIVEQEDVKTTQSTTLSTGEKEETLVEEEITVPETNKVVENRVADTPTTYSFPSGYDDSWTEEQLRQEIQKLLNEAAGLFEENKYRPSTENDYYSKKASAEAALADSTLPKDKLAWQAYYMTNCIKAMNTAQNVLSDSAKQIVLIMKEVEQLNSSEYQLDAWEALSDALSRVRGKINGNASKDYSSELANIQTLYEKMLETKVDEKLIILRDYVAECDELINKQKTDEAVIYDAMGWRNFLTAVNQAKAEIEKGNTTIDEAVFNRLYGNLVAIRNALVPLDPTTEGIEVDVTELWTNLGNRSNIKGGQIFITGEQDNKDGTTTLSVEWINNGLNPLTGEYVGKFTESDLKKKEYKDGVYIVTLIDEFDGFNEFNSYPYYNNWVDEVKPVDSEDVLYGFGGYTITVPTGSKVIVGLGNKADKYYGTFAAGVYQTKTSDTTAPEVKVSYSTTDKTEGPVTVTITANEDIQDIPGWTKTGENTYQKEYTSNATENVDVYDLAGNKTTATVSVTNIVKPDTKPTDPEDPNKPAKPEEDNKKDETSTEEKEESKKDEGVDTSVFLGTGALSATAAAAATGAGLLAFLKKRKK